MWRTSVVCGAENIEVSTHLASQQAFCAVVEANEQDPVSYAGGRLKELMREAIDTTNMDLSSPDLPLAFAHSLGTILGRWAEERLLSVVLYAGVLLEPERARVCTAGDIRVHYLEDGVLRRVTRDHNLIHEDPPPGGHPPQVERMLREWHREILLRAPMRYIGLPPSPPPECVDWVLGQRPSVEVYASEFHLYRPPGSYVGWRAQQGASDAAAPRLFVRLSLDGEACR